MASERCPNPTECNADEVCIYHCYKGMTDAQEEFRRSREWHERRVAGAESLRRETSAGAAFAWGIAIGIPIGIFVGACWFHAS